MNVFGKHEEVMCGIIDLLLRLIIVKLTPTVGKVSCKFRINIDMIWIIFKHKCYQL